MLLVAPEEIREISVSLSVLPDRPRGREELEAAIADLKRRYAGDANFSALPLAELQVAGVSGYMRTRTTMEFAEHMHRTTPLPAPVAVKASEVFFASRGNAYRVVYRAPEELYEKYRQAFDRLLKTLRTKE